MSAAVLVLLAVLFAAPPAFAQQRPNIVMIIMDDVGSKIIRAIHSS